ncbi:hypothetical protein HOLleu_03033 [Holothuria leucospilota]|uniref:Uncharacterized protein n=1 Tax=Holothuria leucospilota TaxID=206669 RepID=A0A9Q1CR42_HOLLE|nr:hypothetical protein HOLleu_03033 [Holothuria leucospilota]
MSISCGDVVSVPMPGDCTTNFGVHSIEKHSSEFIAKGPVIGQPAITISAPVGLLHSSSDKGSLVERRKLLQHQKEQFNLALERSKRDFAFRMESRKHQLSSLLRKEVKLALKSKLPRRSFALGPCQYDTDLSLFHLDFFQKRKAVFSYKDETISHLDEMLGVKWDVLEIDGRCKFISQVTVSLSRENTLFVCVYSSVFWGILGNDYRATLFTDMANNQ